MEQRIQACLAGNGSTEYVLPFFWQRGEEHSVLLEEMDAIQNCGINEFCVESRTHEQFGEDKWWVDFGFLLEEAKKRGMKVWLLDDKHFPSGYANNYIESHPELRAVNARMEFRDFVGPMEDMALIPPLLKEGESFISIAAYRREQCGDIVTGQGIPLLPKMKDGLIWWDIPEGYWRIYFMIRTTVGQINPVYIDMLSAESCKAMIHAVYEPHYEHFKEYFGNTLLGFFSDEPCFLNMDDYYYASLGREEMKVPWNDELPAILRDMTGLTVEDVMLLLPALWHEIEGETSKIREAYMEAVSEAYSRNFCWMLGDWCRAHGVEYIGHTVEDMNAHQRLGHSTGHYFRGLDGQDMAGCDVVLHQIVPGQMDLDHSAGMIGGRVEQNFYLYTLAKLASSHAHVQPLKKGRAMCEVYGAYGWSEGIPTMKHLSDFMLVNGINHFVPHAFSPSYPNCDAPPYFYAHGMNAQYPVFKELMGYLQRTAHILSGGIHQADVAVYYNAEAEWAGGKRMLQQEVARELIRNQIDYDFIWKDVICEGAYEKYKQPSEKGIVSVRDGRLAVNEETYGALIVPYSQYLPENVIKAIDRFASEGLKVWFVDGYPDATSEQRSVDGMLSHCDMVPLDKLADTLKKQDMQRIQLEHNKPLLRFFHTKQGEYDVFMLWNEDIFSGIDEVISFPAKGQAIFYNAWQNKAFDAEQNGNQVRVCLAPSEAVILCFGECGEELPPYDYGEKSLEKLELKWDVSIRKETQKEFTAYPLTELKNLAPELPYFSGVIRYEAVWDVEDRAAYTVMELGGAGEVAQLWINEEYCGAVGSKPYRFAIGGKLKAGKNRLRIEVIGNQGYRERTDWLNSYLPLPPTGLLKGVSVR